MSFEIVDLIWQFTYLFGCHNNKKCIALTLNNCKCKNTQYKLIKNSNNKNLNNFSKLCYIHYPINNNK